MYRRYDDEMPKRRHFDTINESGSSCRSGKTLEHLQIKGRKTRLLSIRPVYKQQFAHKISLSSGRSCYQ